MKVVVRYFAVGVVALSCVAPSFAQDYPNKPVRVVLPFAPGGGTDVNARRFTDRLSRMWKQPVFVENMGGSGGNVAAASVLSRPEDGYTLFFTSLNVLALNPVLYKKLSYDADRDFAPVAPISNTPHVLMVSAALPAAKLSDLIAMAKTQPGGVFFGSGGFGTAQHLAGELLKSRANIDIRHVTYKGSGQAVPAMLGNEIQLIFESISSAIGYLQGGRLRGLGVASPARAAVLPDVPTMEEGGFPGFYSGVLAGVVARTGTPAPVIATINRSANAMQNDPEYKKLMSDLGITLIAGTPEHLTGMIASERKTWVPIIEKLNLRLD